LLLLTIYKDVIMKSRKSMLNVLTKLASVKKANRIKMASHLLNIAQLEQELSVFNYYSLHKAASANNNKSERIKFAALSLRLAQEKKAFAALLGGLARGGIAAGRGLAGMVRGLASGAVPGLTTAASGAKQGLKDYIMAHPLRATAGGVGAGLGGIAAAPTILGAAGGALSGGYQGAKNTINSASQAIGGAGGDIGSRLSGAYQGFTDPKRIPSSSTTSSQAGSYLPRGYKALNGGY
jgi:hypothetical protein